LYRCGGLNRLRAGEAKTLIQLAGRKHVLVVSPAQAHLVGMNRAFTNDGILNACRRNIRESEDGLNENASSELHVLEAVLEPGDRGSEEWEPVSAGRTQHAEGTAVGP
jgi:hypothetical protein